jgi:hypothetical protein
MSLGCEYALYPGFSDSGEADTRLDLCALPAWIVDLLSQRKWTGRRFGWSNVGRGECAVLAGSRGYHDLLVRPQIYFCPFLIVRC